MSQCKHDTGQKHHHRGKSSESLVDKNVVLANLMIKPGQTVLDAGCGNGYMAKEFARLTGKTGKVYALDPDPVSIERLQSETEGTVIEPFVGDITGETKLETSSIDLIYLSTVLHGFSAVQMEGFLKEVKRLLRPMGKLAVVEIKKEATSFGPPLAIRISPEELKQRITLTPLHLTDIGRFFYLHIFEKK
jgi:ubiquinone/menaquinone biosynthesis C-methylase UbiE